MEKYEYKVIELSAGDSVTKVNDYLDEGWEVFSAVAQVVSTSVAFVARGSVFFTIRRRIY